MSAKDLCNEGGVTGSNCNYPTFFCKILMSAKKVKQRGDRECDELGTEVLVGWTQCLWADNGQAYV